MTDELDVSVDEMTEITSPADTDNMYVSAEAGDRKWAIASFKAFLISAFGLFTPVYGGYRNSGLSVTSTTTTTGNNTPLNITVATLAAKASAGITLVAGGGLKNTSGESGVFACTYDFSLLWSNNSGATMDYGWRVRETDDTTYGSLVIGNNGLVFGGTNAECMPCSFTSILTLAPNETAFAGLQTQNGGAMNILSNGSATITRIA